MHLSSYTTLTAILLIFNVFSIVCKEEEWPVGLPHSEIILPAFDDPDTPGAYFDFSAGELVFGEEGKARGDIYLDRTFISGNPALGVELHDGMANSLLYEPAAPDLGSDQWKRPQGDTPARVAIYNGHTLWVLTGEKCYGKLKIRDVESNENVTSYLNIKIEWTYQPDGSNELHAVSLASETDGTNTAS
ncbi:MAG: hypothetical protein NTY09_09950 [bacterium]|nr:hypothetical protein [bacterium]